MTVQATNLVYGILGSTGVILSVYKASGLIKKIMNFTTVSYTNLSKAPFLDLHHLNGTGERAWIDTKPYTKKIGRIVVNNWEFLPNEEAVGEDKFLLRGWKIRSMDPLAEERGLVINCWNDPHAKEPGYESDPEWWKQKRYHVRF